MSKLSVLLLLLFTLPVSAASFEEEIMVVAGSGANANSGDFTGNNGSLDSSWRWFIEVPPGTPQLNIEIFDADIGAVSLVNPVNANDVIVGGNNTSVRYEAFDPTGAQVAGVTLPPGTCTQCNNIFAFLVIQANPTPGHWELRIDSSSAITNGNEFNGIGIRAHDGTAGAGGVELNVYSDSHMPISNATNATVTHQLHPYVTGDCRLSHMDYDLDDGTPAGTANLNSPAGFSQSISNLSGNGAWLRTNVNGYTDNQNATGYGIWNYRIEMLPLGAEGNGNFAQFYLGTQLHSNNPVPVGQPEDDTWRIYLAQDPAVPGTTGAAPLKPFLEQVMRFSSGANPPAVGQLTRVVVTWRLVNPTPRAIDVQSVTGTVPGNQTTFFQEEFVTQGTTTTPASGATGALTWSPGTVAANSTQLFAYALDVTPTATNPVRITGNLNNSGTRMIYRDGTGSAQARALYDTGALCRLRLAVNQLTYAPLHSVVALKNAHDVVVAFESETEIGTESFIIERIRNGRATSLARLAPKGRDLGARYRFTDDKGRLGDEYRIIEIEQSGRRHVRGEATAQNDISALLAARIPERTLAKTAFTSRMPTFANQFGRRAFNGPVGRVVARSAQKGFVRVGFQALASAFARPLSDVEDAARAGELHLENRGREISYLVKDDALTFYNVFERTQASREGVTHITFAPGTLMSQETNAGTLQARALGDLRVVSEYEQDQIIASSVQQDAEGELLFWSGIGTFTGGRDLFETPLNFTGESSASSVLTLEGIGATLGNNTTEVFIDDTRVGQLQTQGLNTFSAEFEIDAGLLTPSSTLRLRSLRDDEHESAIFIDRFSLEHDAAPSAHSFTGRVQNAHSMILGSNTLLADVSDPYAPLLLSAAQERVDLHAGADIYSALADAASDAELTGRPLVALPPINAEHVIIAPSAFMDSLEALRSHRSETLNSHLVDIEDLYDAYTFGHRDPKAIQLYLQDAHARSQTPPRYVLLAGKGTLDPRNALGVSDNLVPTLLAHGEGGLFAADARFADFDEDGVLDVAVGRFPFTQNEQIEAIVSKIIARENQAPQSPHAVFAADSSEAVFEEIARDAIPYLPANATASLFAQETTEASVLEDAFAETPDALLFAGHGSMQKLTGSASGFSVSDVDDLPLTHTSPIVATFSCLTGRFEVPGIDSLGQALLGKSQSGALAFIAPAGLSDVRVGDPLAKAFARVLLQTNDARLGDRLLSVLSEESRGFMLLGDPAQRLPMANPPALEPTGDALVVADVQRDLSPAVFSIEELLSQDEEGSGEVDGSDPTLPTDDDVCSNAGPQSPSLMLLALLLLGVRVRNKRRSL